MKLWKALGLAGLAAPMVDRLRLTTKAIETVALGCDQLAAMPDIVGEITANRASDLMSRSSSWSTYP